MRRLTPQQLKAMWAQLYPRSGNLRKIYARYKRPSGTRLDKIFEKAFPLNIKRSAQFSLRKGEADYLRILRHQFPDVRGKSRRNLNRAMVQKWGDRYYDRMVNSGTAAGFERFSRKLNRTTNQKRRAELQRILLEIQEMLRE